MARILLVDDPDVLATCTGTLIESGHECRGVSHCHDVVRSLMTERPDLVVLNPHLDECKGMRALEAIREFDAEVCVVLHMADSLFGDAYDYFLADQTVLRQEDHAHLLSFIHSKFDTGVVGPESQTPRFHVGVF